MTERAAPLFIGVGNRWRRDDGVGPWIAERLAAAGAEAVEHPGDGAGLILRFAGRRSVVVFDAVVPGAMPGRITRLDCADGPVAEIGFHRGTHQFGVIEAVETARALDLLPRRLVLCGIEGADFSDGEGLTPSVMQAAERVVALELSGSEEAPAGR